MVRPDSQIADYLRRLESRVANTEQELKEDAIPKQIGQFEERVRVSSSVSTNTGAPATVLEDFEDSDFSDYSTKSDDYDALNDGDFAAISGSQVLRLTGGLLSFPGDGLPGYPTIGDSISGWLLGDNFDSADEAELIYGQNEDNWPVAIVLQFDNNNVVVQGGQFASEKESYSLSLSRGTWYRVWVDWRSASELRVTVRELDGTQIFDQVVSDAAAVGDSGDGAVGMGSGFQGTVYHDYYRLNAAEDDVGP